MILNINDLPQHSHTVNVKSGFNLVLCDCNPILCAEWEKNFRYEPKVQIVYGDFKSVPDYGRWF